MKNNKNFFALLGGLMVGGLAYWFQPYNETMVWGLNIWLVMGFGAFIAAPLFMLFIDHKPQKTALFVSLGVLTAIIGRIVYDTLFWDSSSHNLAPLEIIMGSVVTFPSAFIGVYLMKWVKTFIQPQK